MCLKLLIDTVQRPNLACHMLGFPIVLKGLFWRAVDGYNDSMLSTLLKNLLSHERNVLRREGTLCRALLYFGSILDVDKTAVKTENSTRTLIVVCLEILTTGVVCLKENLYKVKFNFDALHEIFTLSFKTLAQSQFKQTFSYLFSSSPFKLSHFTTFKATSILSFLYSPFASFHHLFQSLALMCRHSAHLFPSHI